MYISMRLRKGSVLDCLMVILVGLVYLFCQLRHYFKKDGIIDCLLALEAIEGETACYPYQDVEVRARLTG